MDATVMTTAKPTVPATARMKVAVKGKKSAAKSEDKEKSGSDLSGNEVSGNEVSGNIVSGNGTEDTPDEV